MKRTIITVLATLAAVGFVMLAVGPKTQRVATTTAVAAPAPAPVPIPPRCPNIHQAVEGLRSARQELDQAGHDFCGHKSNAIDAIDHAIKQLQQAEKCAKCQ